MFTGIIQEVGRILHKKDLGAGIELTIQCPQSFSELNIDSSVAVNGVCLTVVRRTAEGIVVQAVEETLKKTMLRLLSPASSVNIELPMRLSDRVGGHLVLGHVDGVGEVTRLQKLETSWNVHVEMPSGLSRYLIPVGSVCVDGVSLTVADLNGETFMVSLIPHTIENTTFKSLERGSPVNIEVDIIGKYVERLLSKQPGDKGEISLEKLQEWGYQVKP